MRSSPYVVALDTNALLDFELAAGCHDIGNAVAKLRDFLGQYSAFMFSKSSADMEQLISSLAAREKDIAHTLSLQTLLERDSRSGQAQVVIPPFVAKERERFLSAAAPKYINPSGNLTTASIEAGLKLFAENPRTDLQDMLVLASAALTGMDMFVTSDGPLTGFLSADLFNQVERLNGRPFVVVNQRNPMPKPGTPEQAIRVSDLYAKSARERGAAGVLESFMRDRPSTPSTLSTPGVLAAYRHHLPAPPDPQTGRIPVMELDCGKHCLVMADAMRHHLEVVELGWGPTMRFNALTEDVLHQIREAHDRAVAADPKTKLRNYFCLPTATQSLPSGKHRAHSGRQMGWVKLAVRLKSVPAELMQMDPSNRPISIESRDRRA